MDALAFDRLAEGIHREMKGESVELEEHLFERVRQMRKLNENTSLEIVYAIDQTQLAEFSKMTLEIMNDLSAHDVALLAAGSLGAGMGAHFKSLDLTKHLGNLKVSTLSNMANTTSSLEQQKKWLEMVPEQQGSHKHFKLTPLGLAELRALCFRGLQHQKLNDTVKSLNI